MDAYRRALSAYLDTNDRTQEAFADAIGCAQPTVNRYVKGERFPDAKVARKIAEATEGSVPFSLWQQVMIGKLGLEGEAA